MAQVKLLKISSDGIPLEFDDAADDITLNSFTAGAGPVMSPTGIEMNDTDVTEISDLSFTDPSVGTINQTAGALIIDNLMAKERQNNLTTAAGIAFPVVANSAGEVDAFRLPAIAGIPTATPTNGGEGHMVWDSSNNKLYVWDGAAWDDQSTVSDAEKVANVYTAAAALAAGEVVYISAANTVDLADVSGGGAPSRVVGVAVAAAASAAAVNVASDGVVKTFAGLTAGSRYYADPATPGGVTTTTPTGSGNTIVQIGYAKAATEMHLQIAQLGRRA